MISHQAGSGQAATGARTTAHQTTGTEPEPLYGGTASRRVTIRDIAAAKERGERWPMLTAYDALTARVFDDAGIPVLLVGDSAAMVVYGHDSTIPVTVDELIPLTAAVVRGTRRALVVADLPFGSYQASPQAALEAATRFLKEAGAHAVKLEGGSRVVRQAEELVAAGIPVMAHLGLTPQSVHAFGGYRVQGRGEDGEQLLRRRQVDAGRRGVRGGPGVRPGRAGRPGHRRPGHPHDRDRRRPGLRRPGAGLAGHGRAVAEAQPGSSSATPTWPACSATPPSRSARRSPAARSPTPSTPTANPRRASGMLARAQTSVMRRPAWAL